MIIKKNLIKTKLLRNGSFLLDKYLILHSNLQFLLMIMKDSYNYERHWRASESCADLARGSICYFSKKKKKKVHHISKYSI